MSGKDGWTWPTRQHNLFSLPISLVVSVQDRRLSGGKALEPFLMHHYTIAIIERSGSQASNSVVTMVAARTAISPLVLSQRFQGVVPWIQTPSVMTQVRHTHFAIHEILGTQICDATSPRPAESKSPEIVLKGDPSMIQAAPLGCRNAKTLWTFTRIQCEVVQAEFTVPRRNRSSRILHTLAALIPAKYPRNTLETSSADMVRSRES